MAPLAALVRRALPKLPHASIPILGGDDSDAIGFESFPPAHFAGGFQESVALAASITRSPIAAVTLLDDEHQWHKAEIGLGTTHMPRKQAFCRFTVRSSEVMVVPDATKDSRFSSNPLVTGEDHIRSYAGAPLIMPNGERIGALCVLDTVPRRYTSQDSKMLELLARHVASQLQLELLVHQQSEDIDDLRQARQELRHLAMHDELTGLLNRRGIMAALEQLFSAAHVASLQAAEQHLSVVFIDLDHFKSVNDQMGHENGDQILTTIARRLSGEFGDDHILGRLGGDEFIIAMVGANASEAAALAETALSLVEQPIEIGDDVLVVEASIGVARAERLSEAGRAIDRADRAMYRRKQAGGRGITVWTSGAIDGRSGNRIANRFVRECIEEDRLLVHFQPMIDLRSTALVRREALLRWNNPTLLQPDVAMSVQDFVSVAEDIGLIQEIGAFVLSESCTAAAQWQRDHPGVGVAVNVSPLQLRKTMPEVVREVLTRTGLDPRLLTLELTETSMIRCTAGTTRILEEMQSIGVRLALDDFGTGWASMSMLCDLPLDEVKLDRRFCSDSSTATQKVVRAAVDLGHSLGLSVVAEGIETPNRLRELVELGCDVGQGYLLGRPTLLPTLV